MKMMKNNPLRSVSKNFIEKRLKFSIDTLRTEVRKDTFINYCKRSSCSIIEVKKNTPISINAKRKIFTKEVTSMHQIQTPNFSNVIISTPHKLNQESDYKKCRLTAFGLSQPDKPLRDEATENIIKIFNKFGVTSFDLAIDSEAPFNTSLLSYFGVSVQCLNTIYINEPLNLSYIAKIKHYDKAYKDNLPNPLYRLELTIKTSGKFEDMFIPAEEISQILEILKIR